MIDKQEIDTKSDELGVHVANVQRDYVFGWLLAGLAQPENRLRPSLILKGGNGFRKALFRACAVFERSRLLNPDGTRCRCSRGGAKPGLHVSRAKEVALSF